VERVSFYLQLALNLWILQNQVDSNEAKMREDEKEVSPPTKSLEDQTPSSGVEPTTSWPLQTTLGQISSLPVSLKTEFDTFLNSRISG
jgi:hypothetical protein